MEERGKIIIAGGSGYIGRALTDFFISQSKLVYILSRNPRPGNKDVKWRKWDGCNVSDWKADLERAEAIINLTGSTIACLHNRQNREEIISSRINSVRVIAEAMQEIADPPAVWVQASAVGYYGNTGDVVSDEESPAGGNFLAKVCELWEQEFEAAEYAGRKVTMRLGSLVGKEAQLITNIEPVVKFFLGGAAGSGKQYLSWVHIEDVVRSIDFMINNNLIAGVYNVVAPEAVTNSELMSALRRQFKRPWVPAAPAVVIKAVCRYIMKIDSSLVLDGNHSSANKLLEDGFSFSYSNLVAALEEIYG